MSRAVMQICSALEKDSGSLYRQQISAINPDASILKGPFNDKDRHMVGLPSSWYNTAEWPQADQHRLLQEKYLSGPSYVVLEEAGHGGVPEAHLQVLRQRIASFCELEDTLT
jgi:hypothetical protein